jgi:hypothetical protein
LDTTHKGKMMTPFAKRCEILSQLWMQYRDDSNFEDFISYNDLGLPIAYAIANEMVAVAQQAELLIDETFELLVAALELEDVGFESLDEMFTLASGEEQSES